MGGQGKGWLRIAIDDYIETGGWWARFKQSVYDRIEGAENGLREAYPGVFESLGDALPDDIPLAAGLKEGISGKHKGGVVAMLGIAAGMGISIIQSMAGPIARIVGYGVERLVHSGRLDPSTIYQAIWRDLVPDQDWTNDLDDAGFHDDRKQVIEVVLRPKVGVSELLTQWLRHEKQDSLIDPELIAQGWTTERIAIMKELSEVIPNVGDLISMAVREAFTPATIELFKYGEDFPTAILPFTRKQGLDDEWVYKYWYAHWVLPSIGQGFQMLHRLRPGTTDVPFEMEDLQTLLRTADIAPFFRQRLIETAYTPLTRVDVRRMYGMGTLARDGVYNAYLDGGYNEANAELMTDFTIKFESQEQRDLTRSVIISAYERTVMPLEETRTSLVDIGYSTENADLFIAISDTKLAQKKIKARLDRAEFLYVEGEIDESGVYTEIGDLNLPAAQVADLIVEWEVTKLKRIALPTKTELEDLYRRDIISRDDYNVGMIKRRYDQVTIDWYAERLDMRVAEDAAKAVERAQKEQERIEKAEYATVYQRIKASMDVEIADIKLQIADIKLAVNYMVDVSEKKAAKTAILTLKTDIASWNLAKAEIKMQSTQPAPTEG